MMYFSWYFRNTTSHCVTIQLHKVKQKKTKVCNIRILLKDTLQSIMQKANSQGVVFTDLFKPFMNLNNSTVNALLIVY